jgi:hypothetical protein
MHRRCRFPLSDIRETERTSLILRATWEETKRKSFVRVGRYEEKREGRRKEKKTEMKHRRWSYSVNLAQRERTNGMRGGDAAKKDTKRRR